MTKKTRQPWGGRFKGKTDPLMIQFSQSVSFDKRLALADARGSIAHAGMLAKQGIIPATAARKIIKALKEIMAELESGKFEFKSELEDVHMNIEARLVEKIGDAGRMLHTGRSRNDQVALDLRLWMRDEIDAISALIGGLMDAFIGRAERNVDVIMPGYTHLQRAQPVTMAHHMMAYVEMLGRDMGRFADARRRVNVMPLGAGALAGSSLPLDPKFVAAELGFDAVAGNSMDAVSDRDFALEFLFDCALCQVHLSRLAEELVLWSTVEFGFVELPESFCTGSSLMPQKKNPDAAELVRGKAGRSLGDLVALFTTLKGTPLAYNRDFQEDKERLFDSADTLKASLSVLAPVIEGLEINAERCEKALAGGHIMATDLAEYLVRKGMPFRSAHEVVGKIARLAVTRGIELTDIPLADYRGFSNLFDKDLYGAIEPGRSLVKRAAGGGPAPKSVKAQIRRWKRRLAR